MSNDQQAKKKKPGFRPGVCVKNNKLYAFSKVRVVVVKGWPEMAAWTKTYSKPQWSRFRPKIDFQEGSIEATRSRHRCQPGQYNRHAPDREDPFQPNASDWSLLEWLDSEKAEVREFAKESVLLEWKYSPEPVQYENSSDPVMLKMIQMHKESEAIAYERELVRHFFGDVPWKIRKAVAPFEDRHWHLLVMAARCPGSLDLIMSNPALAYCLASCWAFGPYPSKYATRTMRRLIDSRRRSICGALGFPECESSVSVLSKIPASACCVSWLLTIRDLLKDHAWRKPLLHLPSLNLGVMQFLCSKALRRRATPRLLHELSGIDGPAMARSASDLMRMQRQLGDAGKKRFHSVQQFVHLHDELEARIHGTRLAYDVHGVDASDMRSIPFPMPPIPGSEAMIALENFDLLKEEAREQHNCLMTYLGNVVHGDTYFYRVLKPERSTLSLVKNQIGEWRFDQLLKARNEPVSAETRQAVEQWIMRTMKPSIPNAVKEIL